MSFIDDIGDGISSACNAVAGAVEDHRNSDCGAILIT